MSFDDFEKDKFKNEEAPAFTWTEVWQAAVLKPSQDTYETLLSDRNASSRRAATWLFCMAWASVLVVAIAGVNRPQTTFQTTGSYTSFLLGYALCGGAIGALLAVVFSYIGSGFLQLVARLFGGQGKTSELFYLQSAIGSPLSVVNITLSVLSTFVPGVGLVSFIVSLYSLYLGGLALKTVNRFSWGKTIATYMVLLVGVCGFFAFLFFSVINISSRTVYR